MRSLCLLLLTVFIISALAHKRPLDRFGNIKVPCATEDVYEQRHERARTCATRGPCDGEAYRDQHGNTQNIITINTAVHVMRSNQGESPDGVGQAQVDTMMDRLNQYYGAYGITFQTSTYYHNNNTYYCIPAYSGTNPAWSEAIDDMKKEYAVNAASTLNIFISCQKSSLQGTLFGIATFPWDTKALTSTGGLWLNSIAVDDEAQANGDITLEHEMGHCLGLWHTFHGSDEVLGCNLPCEETPHLPIDPAANSLGDFCSDTPATPRNYACADPAGDSCSGAPWGTTDYTNFMGYGMDPQPCGNHFTDQQARRMHCWVCDALPGITLSGC